MEQEIARLRAEAAEHRRAAAQLRNSTLFTLNVPPPPSIAPKEILVAPTPAIAIDQTGSTQVRIITAAPRTRTPVIPKPFVGMEDHVVASRVRARLADEKARAADREVASRLLARLREDAAESKVISLMHSVHLTLPANAGESFRDASSTCGMICLQVITMTLCFNAVAFELKTFNGIMFREAQTSCCFVRVPAEARRPS